MGKRFLALMTDMKVNLIDGWWQGVKALEQEDKKAKEGGNVPCRLPTSSQGECPIKGKVHQVRSPINVMSDGVFWLT